MEEKELKERIKKFCSNYQDEHSLNVTDFKVSKNIAAGNGFQVWSGSTVWNKDRAKVCVNLMEPIINSVVYKFTENPFDFKVTPNKDIPEDLQALKLPEIDFTELKFQLGFALRDAIVDGLSYILTYKKDNKIGFKRLNNFNVVFGESEYSNGKDAKEVMYIDKRNTGKKQRKSEMGITFQTMLDLKPEEIPVITYYYKEGDVVNTIIMESDEIISQSSQPLKAIPITRIYAKEVPINFKKNWRGLYYLVKDLLQTIDLEMSLVQERIVTAPNHGFWIAEESLGSDIESYARVNDFPTAFKTYRAYNANCPGVTLPPPTKNDLSTNIADLMTSFGVHKDIVYSILGNISGDGLNNETAEAVLLRRETKDTATNDLIRNLLDSANHIINIVENLLIVENVSESGEVQLIDTVKLTVTSDFFEKAKQNDELQKILALTQLIQSNKIAYSILPVIVAKMDVDEKSKTIMMELLSEDRDDTQELEQQIEMLKQENQQLTANNEANLQAAQMQAQARMATAEIDYRVKIEELKFKWAELEQKATEAGIKLNIDKTDSNRQLSNDEKKTELEAAKFAAEQIRGQ